MEKSNGIMLILSVFLSAELTLHDATCWKQNEKTLTSSIMNYELVPFLYFLAE